MGRAKVEDLPRSNAVTLQIEIHQSALARDPDGVRGRWSERLDGPPYRNLRVAFVEWIGSRWRRACRRCEIRWTS